MYKDISISSDEETYQDECVICFEPIPTDQLYVMINAPGESSKFHFPCITKWLEKSTNGILTQQPITKLNICDNNSRDDTCIPINNNNTNTNTNIIANLTIQLPEKLTDEYDDYGDDDFCDDFPCCCVL